MKAPGEDLKEFCKLHHDELEGSVARTGLFSDYVAFCKQLGHESHANLVQFCRECAAWSGGRHILH